MYFPFIHYDCQKNAPYSSFSIETYSGFLIIMRCKKWDEKLDYNFEDFGIAEIYFQAKQNELCKITDWLQQKIQYLVSTTYTGYRCIDVT